MARRALWLLLWLHAAVGVLGQPAAPVITWEMNMYGVEEDEGMVEVCATLAPPDNFTDLTVIVTTSPVNAEVSVDYIDLSGTAALLQWTTTNLRACLNIVIIDDNIVESEEVFTVNIAAVAERNPMFPDPQFPLTIVMILDNDAIEVIFTTVGDIMVRDNVGVTEVCVGVGEMQVDPTVPFRIPITVETVDGSATSDVDFVPIDNMTTPDMNRAVLTPGNREHCFNVTINERTDASQDNREFIFQVALTDGAVVTPDRDRVGFAETNKTIIIEPTAQVVTPAGDVVDTIVGDPLYTLSIDANGNAPSTLCYEIHGNRNRFLNLVSDRCFSINAHYSEVTGASGRNIIDELTLRTGDLTGGCVDIFVSSQDDCQAVFVRTDAGFERVNTTFYYRGVQITFLEEAAVEILLPCLEIPGQGIRVILKCPMEHYYDTISRQTFDIKRLWVEFQRNSTIEQSTGEPHGLVGQFWHPGFTVSKYTGEFSDGSVRPNAYEVTTPPGPNRRTFVGLEYPLTWDYMEKPCIYVGNRQGGPAVDVPGDSVIEGSYSDYEVDFHFAVSDRYPFFDITQYGCPFFPSLPLRPVG